MINASNTNLFNRYSNLACNSYYGIPIEPENLFEQGHEQDYGERILIELLQNADDAQSTKAILLKENPIETVQLEKRVKQWEWFCSGFDGERQFYPY